MDPETEKLIERCRTSLEQMATLQAEWKEKAAEVRKLVRKLETLEPDEPRLPRRTTKS